MDRHFERQGVHFVWNTDKADRNLLFVVHIEIDGEDFRIISARRATTEEWTLYED